MTSPFAPPADLPSSCVRNDMSRDKVDIFMRQVTDACQYLDGQAMPATEPERKTHDHQRRRC